MSCNPETDQLSRCYVACTAKSSIRDETGVAKRMHVSTAHPRDIRKVMLPTTLQRVSEQADRCFAFAKGELNGCRF